MTQPIEEVLGLWRELERVRDALPAADPARDLVAHELVEVRRLYRRLTQERQDSAARLAASRATLTEARALIRTMHERLAD